MNAAYLHLILNHFPIIGITGGILISAFGLLQRNEELKRLGLTIYVLVALIAIPV